MRTPSTKPNNMGLDGL